jgi:hypothetical protein
MLSLLNQHICQLVRLDPKSRRAELLTTKSVCQVELAESHRKKSIAKKVKSCYSDRAVNHKQTGCVVTDHSRNRRLRDLEASQGRCKRAEQHGKDFVKDLGVNRKK